MGHHNYYYCALQNGQISANSSLIPRPSHVFQHFTRKIPDFSHETLKNIGRPGYEAMQIVCDNVGYAPCTSVNHFAAIQFIVVCVNQSHHIKLNNGNPLFAMLALGFK